VRSAAADALRYDPSAETTEALLKAAQDEFRTVRIRAASSLIGRDLTAWGDEGETAFSAARDEYWNSLVIWPDRWSTYYNQGIYFDRLAQPEEALKAYEKSRKLRSDLIQPVINASMVYARTGDNTNAYRMLQEALAIEPDNAMTHFNLALLEAEFGNLDATETHLRAALEDSPGMAQAAYNLGILLCRDNQQEGFEWLRTAALEVPENWDYTSSYLFFLNRDQRLQEIESILLELVATKRAAPEVYFTLVGDYQRSGRIADAIEICRKAKYSKWLFPDAKRYAAQMEQTLRENNTQ
jgi:tetratricopeptide (TPR) repeat protein